MMTRNADPFDRAVAREERLRKRAGLFETRKGVMRLAATMGAALGAGWALVLAGHWLVFPEPRWLAVLHTVVFALMCGYFVFGFVLSSTFMRFVERSRPDLFDDE